MAEFQHERHDPPHGNQDPGLWEVHISLATDEPAALGPQLAALIPQEQVTIYSETVAEEPTPVLTLRVRAETADEAIANASRTLRKARAAAGRDSQLIRILGYISPFWISNEQTLSQEAGALQKSGRYELAVVRRQTLTEIRIRKSLGHLFADKFPEVDPSRLFPRTANLTDRRSLEILTMLTGRRIQNEPWWPDYKAHIERRNGIIHEGIQITRGEALASLRAALSLDTWLTDLTDDGEGEGDETSTNDPPEDPL